MLTLSELKTLILKEEEKRDLLYEHSTGNMSVFKKMCEGTFEAVETGNGREKCLIPQVAALNFLFRGQCCEFSPCLPVLYRGHLSEVDIFCRANAFDSIQAPIGFTSSCRTFL